MARKKTLSQRRFGHQDRAATLDQEPRTKPRSGDAPGQEGHPVVLRMKVHIEVDSQSGLIHSANVTPGNIHDSQELPNLLPGHGKETRLSGDSTYRGEKQRQRLKELAYQTRHITNRHGYKNRPFWSYLP